MTGSISWSIQPYTIIISSLSPRTTSRWCSSIFIEVSNFACGYRNTKVYEDLRSCHDITADQWRYWRHL